MTPKKATKVRDMYAQYRAHPVAVAIDPLRVDAMDYVEKMFRERVAAFAKRVETETNERDVLCPSPDERKYWNKLSNAKYHQMLADRAFMHSITRILPKVKQYDYKEPQRCEIDPEAVEKAVRDEREMASLQYDMFIVKLIGKIGDCLTAEIDGNHVWGLSRLTVHKVGDVKEIWKTQQIYNRSSLGKWFPQWPSRQINKGRT